MISKFSEALRIMDRNTTKYMIDDMTKQRDDAKSRLYNAEIQRDDAISALKKIQQENAELKARLS